MRGPTAKFYIGFGSTWSTLDASISWTEVTSYVMSERGAGSSRGRSSELDDMRAGTGSFVLNNTTRRFDPTYTAGPYYGQLLPGVPVKITGTANSVEYPVLRGFVNGWPQDYDPSNKLGYVNVGLTDGFAKLATAGTPSSVYALEVDADDPKAWWRMTETAGSSMLDSSGNGYHGTYSDGTTILSDRHPNEWETLPGIDWDGDHYAEIPGPDSKVTAAPLVIEAIVKAPLVDPATPGQVHLLFRVGHQPSVGYIAGAGGTGATLAFTVSLSNASMTGRVTTAAFMDGLVHHVAFRRTTGTSAIYIDGVVAATTSSVPTGTFDFGSTIAGENAATTSYVQPGWLGLFADLAIYDTDIGTTRIADHAAALMAPWDGDSTGDRIERILSLGWPSDLLDIATGFTVLGPAKLGQNQLQLIKGYEKAELGRFFISRDGKATFRDRYYHQTVTAGSTSQATFSDDGSDNRYCSIAFDYDDRLIYNRVRGSRSGGGPVEVFDQTSIDAYGEQVDSSLDGIQVGTDAVVRGAAELRLDRYKDPQLRVRPIELKLHGLTAAQQADVLDLELGYRVTVERTPQAVGSQITQETVIEGISHRMSGGQWTTTLTLSPVDTRTYAIWGTALWDSGLWGY